MTEERLYYGRPITRLTAKQRKLNPNLTCVWNVRVSCTWTRLRLLGCLTALK